MASGLCELCNYNARIQGERFCRTCRKVVLASLPKPERGARQVEHTEARGRAQGSSPTTIGGMPDCWPTGDSGDDDPEDVKRSDR